MQQVKIYIETDSSSPKATEKHYGYVLEVMVSGQAVTREGFGKITGTYHQTVLTALAKALDRFNQSCEVCICTEDDFVLNMLERNLAIWAGNEFLTSKRKPVANQQEWMEIWRLSNRHLILTEPGKHEYTGWLQGEIEKRKRDNDGTQDHDHGAADEAGTGQEEDDTDGEESGQADCEEPAERTDEQTGAQSQREEIAPAQKSTETLEKEEVEDDETGENESSDAENQTAESEPKTAEREQTEETEVIEAVYGTRKEYMDRLSEQGMAEYMADEYKSHRLLVTDLENTWNLCKWLSEKVDRFGKPMEDAR